MRGAPFRTTKWSGAFDRGENNLDRRVSPLARGHFRAHRRRQSDAAETTVQGIFERVQVLAEYPEMGHRYLHSSRNVRVLHYGHFRIAYLIKADGDVDILGVFHGALDITKYQL